MGAVRCQPILAAKGFGGAMHTVDDRRERFCPWRHGGGVQVRAVFRKGKGKREDGKRELRSPRDTEADAMPAVGGRFMATGRRAADVGAAVVAAAALHVVRT